MIDSVFYNPDQIVEDYLDKIGFHIHKLKRTNKPTLNYIYRAWSSTDCYFIKFFKHHNDLVNASQRACTEYEIQSSAPNVPKCIHFSQDPPIIISECIDGLNLLDLFSCSFSSNTLIKELAKWLADFHLFFTSKESSTNNIERGRTIVIFREIIQCDFISSTEKRKILRKLKRLPDTTNNVKLVGDTTLKNFLYVNHNKLIGTDFEFSHHGDPAKDIGLACASMLFANPHVAPNIINSFIRSYETFSDYKVFQNVQFYIPYFLFWIPFSDPNVPKINKELSYFLRPYISGG